MSEFIYDPNSGELYHYGVKGMKWGVRRAIGKQARAYAKGYYANRKLGKKVSKLDKKIGKATEKYGKSSDKVKGLKAKRSKLNKSRANVQKLMSQNVKGLSKKDIAQGKRDYMTRKAVKTVMGIGTAAVTAYTAYNVGRAIILLNHIGDGLMKGIATAGKVAGAVNEAKALNTAKTIGTAASTLNYGFKRKRTAHMMGNWVAETSNFPHLR